MVEHVQKLLPGVSEKWLAIKEKLDENPIIDIGLDKIAFKTLHAPEFEEAALAGLLDYLEFSGNIIKFPEPSSLSNYVFPNPPKLSSWIYGTVLNEDMLEKNDGIIKYSSIQKKIGEDEAKIFLGIMDKFNLLFTEKGNDDNLVIPQFLPENNNSFKRLILELIPYSFCLRFADFFHESRIFQFISEYGEYADDKTSYWRYGLVFTIDNVNALVYYNQEKRIVFVHLENKKGRIQLAQEIFDFFSYVEVNLLKSEEKLQLLRNSLRERHLSTIIRNRANSNIRGPIDSTMLERLVDWELTERKIWSFARQEFKNHVREKVNPDELIEGVQISINREDYIDIKETLQNNTDDFPVGICVESRKRIKLDNLTLNLLGMMNRKLPKVFISYSRKDLEFKNQMRTHLSLLERYDLLKTWDCNEIKPGDWESQIQTNLEEADILVYMVSHNFMASDYIMEKEVKKGVQMVKDNPEKKIICVLTRPCMWQSWSFMEETFNNVIEQNGVGIFSDSMDLSKFQFLPYHGYRDSLGEVKSEEIVALEEWGTHPYGSRNVAYTQIVKHILGEATRRN